MSRIGKKPILIQDGVEVLIKEQEVKIKGPKGEITQIIPEEILVVKKENMIEVSLKRESERTFALWGLTRALLQNNIKGVKDGFTKKLEIIGIGYKANLKSKNELELEVGFSHTVNLKVPENLNISIEKNIITISGFDKQKVGEFAANIRKVKKPEPYQGKGIRYVGEKVRKKVGKKAATTK